MMQQAVARLPGLRRISLAVLVAAIALLAYGSINNPNFWRNATQRGDRLMAEKNYRAASKAYDDPWRIGVAQYRNGDFKAAAQTFTRVPGANGAFNSGNALLMQGQYDAAIAAYDRALGFRPGWQAARDNQALAVARKQRIDTAGEQREQKSTDAYSPDGTVVDHKGDERKSKPLDMNSPLSDAELRASWLRRVQTTPADFLRAKFAYQAEHMGQQAAPPSVDATPP